MSDYLCYDELYADFSMEVSDSLGSNEFLREQEKYNNLWKAVILQSVADSINNYKRAENKLEKVKARSWLSDLNNDFITVCDLSGYNPLYVYGEVKKIISQHINNERK